MDSSCSPTNSERDWAAQLKPSIIAWGIPITMFVAGFLFTPVLKYIIYPVAMTWFGVACLLNARRCGRAHCFFTGAGSIGFAIFCTIAPLASYEIDWFIVMTAYTAVMIAGYTPEFLGIKYFKKGART